MIVSDKKLSLILDIGFMSLALWWVSLVVRNVNSGSEGYYFNLAYALFAIYAGYLAIRRSKEWGGVQSLYGKTLLGLGLGIIGWGIGGILWAYYNFGGFMPQNFINPQTIDEVPYPSLADIGFFSYNIFAFYGMWALLKAVGVRYAWSNTKARVALIITPIIGIALTFYRYNGIRVLALTPDNSYGQLFMDYAYTIGDAILLTVGIIILVLSPRFINGKLKTAFLFITFAFFLQYIADYVFAWRASNETYYNADISDMLYATSLYTLAVGCTMFTLKDKR